MTPEYPWERPLGARPLSEHETEFRVWAPAAERISLLLEGGEVPLYASGHGVYETIAAAPPGTDYAYLVDGRQLPDPAARWQPGGLRGPSRVHHPPPPAPFPAAPLAGQVIYELHVGTFSAEGTFDGAIPHLAGLAELGVSAIEIMPVAEFPGERGWGYDGVYLSAPQSSYGGPDGLGRLIEAAHRGGLAVILDVVYNHVGASGVEALRSFGPYLTSRYETPWGEAINYDGADCDPVREWVLQSAEGWVRDFGVDGLRLDAIHAIFDASAEHIVAAIARRVRAIRPGALVIAESALNDPKVITGYGASAVWADDFHHSLRTLLTDEGEGYYSDFGRMADLAKAWHRPFVYDGRYSEFRRRRVGAPADALAPESFVVFSQNHDQVGNRAFGDRMPAPARPLAAFCTLLAPFTAMLFMGEEYGERAPFQFFTDHIDRRIAEATRAGRRAEFAAFASFEREIPDPQDRSTFEASKLTRVVDPAIDHLYRALLRARRELPRGEVDAIAFDEEARWLRVGGPGFELACNFAPEPVALATERSSMTLATGAGVRLGEGILELPPLSGALLR